MERKKKLAQSNYLIVNTLERGKRAKGGKDTGRKPVRDEPGSLF